MEGSLERLRLRLLGEERSAGCSGGEPIWSMVEFWSHTSGASREGKSVVAKAVRRRWRWGRRGERANRQRKSGMGLYQGGKNSMSLLCEIVKGGRRRVRGME